MRVLHEGVLIDGGIDAYNRIFLGWFARSLVIIGVCVLILYLVCAGPRFDPDRWYVASFDWGMTFEGVRFLVMGILLRSFIVFQLKVWDCLRRIVKTRPALPRCLLVIKWVLYMIAALYLLFGMFCSLPYHADCDMPCRGILFDIPEYWLSMTWTDRGIVGRMEEAGIIGIYLIAFSLIWAWCVIGIARLILLIGENSMMACNLKGILEKIKDSEEGCEGV